jgi:hypothetical protein
MREEKEYRIDLLTEKSVTVVTKTFIITDDNKKLQVGDTNSACYNNSNQDRKILKDVLPQHYYNGVIAVWGDTPIVKDIVVN